MDYKVPFYKATYLSNIENINRSNFEEISKNGAKNLEEKFLNLTNCNYILSANNPSSAIHLALCAIEVKRGDKIITAVNSYADIPEAIRHFDSEPIFTDIESKTYNIDLNSLKSAIKSNKSKKLKAIIVTHFAGLKAKIDEIVELAKENNLLVIEDFTDSQVIDRAEVKGDIAIFSLNYKLDNTLKGAIIAFKDEEIFNIAKLLRNHGLISSNKDVSYLYDIVDIGCDYRLDNLSAYILEALIDERKNLLNRRKEIANIYFKELKDTPHITLPIESNEHLYTYYIVEVDKNRDAFARELKSLGVEVGLHYIPLNFTSYYKDKYGLKIFNFPNALSAYQKIMSLPCNGKMSKDEALYVVDSVKKVASKHI